MRSPEVSTQRARFHRRPSFVLTRRAYEKNKNVYHKDLQPFFKFVNNLPLKATESVWLLTPVIQAIGLVNKRAAKLANAFYGACWSIVYSCFRPWAAGRERLPEKGAGKKIPEGIRTAYDINEHFRMIMGTAVAGVYGGGAFGMLYSWIKNDDDLFDKTSDIYRLGMLNQNQIFASMNLSEVLKRYYAPEKLHKCDRMKNSPKSVIELIDSVLFLPTFITRAIDTTRPFGAELGEGTQRIVNSFAYFSYGTWAVRYGTLKQTEDKEAERGSGLLDKINPKLKGLPRNIDEGLQISQKYGGKIFSTMLPGLSWISAGAELFGYGEFAKDTFKLEGILERINPAIFSWCGRNTWLKLFEKEGKEARYEMAA